MKPIKVELWQSSGRRWQLNRTIKAGTYGQALKRAKEALGPLLVTRDTYHRDMGRADHAVIVGRGGYRAIIEPDTYVVSSVGELGVSP